MDNGKNRSQTEGKHYITTSKNSEQVNFNIVALNGLKYLIHGKDGKLNVYIYVHLHTAHKALCSVYMFTDSEMALIMRFW